MNLSTIEGARLSQPKLIMEIDIKIKKKNTNFKDVDDENKIPPFQRNSFITREIETWIEAQLKRMTRSLGSKISYNLGKGQSKLG